MNKESVEKRLFVSWRHPASKRTAILEELNGMVWLYLTSPDSMQPERDCPAFTTVPPTDKVDWKRIEETGEPPPISKEIASSTAIISQPSASDFAAKWSLDGESVAVVRNDQIICMIVAGIERGHSRSFAKESPLGLPFDEALASKFFLETND